MLCGRSLFDTLGPNAGIKPLNAIAVIDIIVSEFKKVIGIDFYETSSLLDKHFALRL